MQDLDNLDFDLLNLIRQNNKRTAEELGDEIGLSPSAVQRRIKKFRENGIVTADISIIPSVIFGNKTSVAIEISLHMGGTKSIESFKQLMLQVPEVSQCFYVAGSIDFIIIVQVADIKAYDAFAKKHLMDNQEIKQFHSHIIMDTVKYDVGMMP